MRQQQDRYPDAGVGTERGYVLVIVMGLLAILGVMSLSLRAATHTSLEQTRHLQDAIAAEFLAKAGIDWTRHYLHQLERQDIMWQAPWSGQEATFHGHKLGPGAFDISYRGAAGTLHPGLQDEEARLHINTVPVGALAALPGMGQERAQAIVAARQQTPWRTPEELVQRGFIAPELWQGSADQIGLHAYLTTWGSGKINVNTAPSAVLAALPGSTPALVEALIRYRQGADQQWGTADDRHFRTLQEIDTVPGMDHPALERLTTLLTVTSSAFRFVATGRIARQALPVHTHQRFAVLERLANTTALRYWRQVE